MDLMSIQIGAQNVNALKEEEDQGVNSSFNVFVLSINRRRHSVMFGRTLFENSVLKDT